MFRFFAAKTRFATVPDVSWDDVGALEPLREELNYAILQPIRKPEIYGRMVLPPSQDPVTAK